MTSESEHPNLLVNAAKVIGGAAGTLASLGHLGAGHKPAPTHSPDGKLLKKHKHRLPRKQKKAMKARAEQGAGQV